MNKQRTVCVDFDGVLYDGGRQVLGAAQAVEQLLDKGWRVVIFTVRANTASGKQFVMDWLDKHDIQYHDVTAMKPNADFFIDDRAIFFRTWQEALEELELRDPLSVLE